MKRNFPKTWLSSAARLAMVIMTGPLVTVCHAQRPPEAAGSAQSQPAPLSARVAFITGQSADARAATLGERLAALRRLSPVIPPADASALLAFASAPQPGEFPPSHWHALVNDILDLLLRLPAPPADLSRGLLAMTEHSDPVLSDYALQKLDKLARLPLPPAARQEIAGALARAAARAGAPSQGTALLTWRRLTEDFPQDFDRDAFRKGVTACLRSPDASPAAKTAALSAGAAAGLPETAPAARALLAHPEASVSLRISALHALGAAGGREDIPLITQYLSVLGCDGAAASALKKL